MDACDAPAAPAVYTVAVPASDTETAPATPRANMRSRASSSLPTTRTSTASGSASSSERAKSYACWDGPATAIGMSFGDGECIA